LRFFFLHHSQIRNILAKKTLRQSYIPCVCRISLQIWLQIDLRPEGSKKGRNVSGETRRVAQRVFSNQPRYPYSPREPDRRDNRISRFTIRQSKAASPCSVLNTILRKGRITADITSF
jgi:hypothetical protein